LAVETTVIVQLYPEMMETVLFAFLYLQFQSGHFLLSLRKGRIYKHSAFNMT